MVVTGGVRRRLLSPIPHSPYAPHAKLQESIGHSPLEGLTAQAKENG